jgi:tight adherence protein B
VNSAIAGAVLASVAAGGLAYVFVYPLLSGDARAEKRQKALVESGPERRIDRISAVNRRDQVAQSLKELEARQKARHKVSIEARITQAGLTWTKRKFFIVSAVAALVLALALLVISGNPIVAAGGIFASPARPRSRCAASSGRSSTRKRLGYRSPTRWRSCSSACRSPRRTSSAS